MHSLSRFLSLSDHSPQYIHRTKSWSKPFPTIHDYMVSVPAQKTRYAHEGPGAFPFGMSSTGFRCTLQRQREREREREKERERVDRMKLPHSSKCMIVPFTIYRLLVLLLPLSFRVHIRCTRTVLRMDDGHVRVCMLLQGSLKGSTSLLRFASSGLYLTGYIPMHRGTGVAASNLSQRSPISHFALRRESLWLYWWI